eukprot:Selendium_serpulae@DN5991_c0_g1_i8.p1
MVRRCRHQKVHATNPPPPSKQNTTLLWSAVDHTSSDNLSRHTHRFRLNIRKEYSSHLRVVLGTLLDEVNQFKVVGQHKAQKDDCQSRTNADPTVTVFQRQNRNVERNSSVAGERGHPCTLR